MRREQLGNHEVAHAGGPAGVEHDDATGACGLGAEPPGGGGRAHGHVDPRAALAQHHALGGQSGMGHGIDDQVNASACWRHRFRTVEVHDGRIPGRHHLDAPPESRASRHPRTR
jgi:hypothetical protein